MVESELPTNMSLMQECEDVLNRCKALELSLIGIKSRVSLGISAKPVMNGTKWELMGLTERVYVLMRLLEEES